MILEVNLGSLQIELGELSVDSLDIELDKAIKEKQKQAFTDMITSLDDIRSAQRTCRGCGTEMISNGFVKRKLGIIAGEVELKKRRFRCPSCKKEHYPLDLVLEKNKKHTLPVIERALFLATDLSYEKSSKTLLKLTGAKMSSSQIQIMAAKEGSMIGQDLENQTSDLFGLGIDPGEVVKRGPSDTLVIAIDGGHIPDRGTRNDFEAKVGVIYGIKANISKDRTMLVDRVAYASLENAYVFGQKLFCLARRHGCMSAGRVLAIGDGATWIRRLITDMFPGAIYLLDLYHLKKKVQQTFTADEDEAFREKLSELLSKGEPEEAIDLMKSYKPGTEEHKERVRKLMGYVRYNRIGIKNYKRSDLFGSGAVEKAIDLLVSRRFKSRGMSWFKPGAKGMLALRLLRFNQQWDHHWKWRMQPVRT